MKKQLLFSFPLIPLLLAVACSSKIEEENKSLREANTKLAAQLAKRPDTESTPTTSITQAAESRTTPQSVEKSPSEAKRPAATTIKEWEIKGEVFIARRDGQTLKLSLVPVSIVTESEAAQFRKENLKLSKQKADLMHIANHWQQAVGNELRQIGEFLEATRTLEVTRSALAKQIEERAEKVASMRAEGDALRGPDRFTKSADINHEILKLTAAGTEIGEKWRALGKEIEDRQTRLEGKKARVTTWRQDAAMGLKDFEDVESSQFLLATQLTKKAQCITDGNGEFSARVSQLENLFLCATASREVGQKTEFYVWLLPVQLELTTKKIMLSNHNLYKVEEASATAIPKSQ